MSLFLQVNNFYNSSDDLGRAYNICDCNLYLDCIFYCVLFAIVHQVNILITRAGIEGLQTQRS